MLSIFVIDTIYKKYTFLHGLYFCSMGQHASLGQKFMASSHIIEKGMEAGWLGGGGVNKLFWQIVCWSNPMTMPNDMLPAKGEKAHRVTG